MQHAKIENIEDKIHDITNLATNTTLNNKINDIENKTPSIDNLATTPALTTIQKNTYFFDLVKREDYDAKISEMENKYFTTADYNKFTSHALDAKTIQKKFVNEFDINKKIKTLER